MKCIILAAGYATRLSPLTDNFPKPLLDVKGRPIVDWLVDDIDATHAVDEFIIVTNHRFVSHFQTWGDQKPQRITVVDDGTESNETRLGAVKDIQYAIETLKLDDDLLVVAGDNVLDFSLASFIRYAQEHHASCTMRYYEPDKTKLVKRGVMSVGSDDQILFMEEKPAEPKDHWCCPPFYVYRREDLNMVSKGIQAGCGTDAPGSFIAWLSGKVVVYAMEMPGRRYDIGDLEGYRRIQQEYCGIVR